MNRLSYLIIGCSILLFFSITAILAPYITPFNQTKGDMPYLGVSKDHFLGTNDMGEDIFIELIHAGRVSLSIGIIAAIISILAGGTIGILAGYFKGVTGELFTGLIDVFLLIPMLPLMVMLAAYLGQGWWNIVLAISLIGWCATARAVRAKVLQLREALFIQSLKGIGIPTALILRNHMLPHVFEILSARFVLAVSGAMLSEASLSFIGLGSTDTVSWGMMIHYAFIRGGFSGGMWWWYLPPGLCIGLSALGFILIGFYFESANSWSALNNINVDENG